MVPAPLTDLMIRPELRYGRSLNATNPFNDSSDKDMFTAAVDLSSCSEAAAILFDLRAGEPEMHAYSRLR